jgi:hypothetical protein
MTPLLAPTRLRSRQRMHSNCGCRPLALFYALSPLSRARVRLCGMLLYVASPRVWDAGCGCAVSRPRRCQHALLTHIELIARVPIASRSQTIPPTALGRDAHVVRPVGALLVSQGHVLPLGGNCGQDCCCEGCARHPVSVCGVLCVCVCVCVRPDSHRATPNHKRTHHSFYNANAATTLFSIRQGGSGFSGICANFYPQLVSWLCAHPDAPEADELQTFMAVAENVIMYK